MICCLAFLLLGGCIDLSQSPERECLAERRCGPSEASACGVDGVEYECAAIATCYGVEIDPSGEACGTQPQCEDVACRLYCENGYKTDSDGCEICECRDEEPQCSDVMCNLACENGFETDENGCEICECREPDGGQCEEDPCVAYHCADRRGMCERESVLAASGACPAPDFTFWEPLPQCECGDDLCAPLECASDSECGGDLGLCVRTPNEDRAGYCVNAACEYLLDEYERVARTQNSCNTDSDCEFYSPSYDCCGGVVVNERGVQEMGAIDAFANRTSCGDDWADDCAVVDCAMPEPIAISCVQGTCRMSR
jgi:hypothetical protein